jgi:hypothetical protein
MSTSKRPAAAATALLLALALGAAGCSGDDGDDPAARGSASPSTAPPPVRTKTSLGTVTGHLAGKARQRVVAQAGHVVDGWFDAAYVGGHYPRHDFGDAFPLFTTGARAQAHADQALMTNRTLGPSVEDVTATRRRVRVDVLAVRHRAVGLTARFALDFRTTGRTEREIEVGGRLMLTHTGDGWRVFAYDVHKGRATGHEHVHQKARRKGHRPNHPDHGSGSGKSGRKGGGR